MAEYRIAIPSELLDAGFPVEWVVITDEGSVYIHYSNPVVLETMNLDDRRVVEDPGPTLRMLIGTGQTIEITTKRANGLYDLVERCPNCKQTLPETLTHPWVQCPSPSSTLVPVQCYECMRMAERIEIIRDAGAADQIQTTWRTDGYCGVCGQKPARMRLMETVKKTLQKTPINQQNSKTLREIARLMRRLNKEG